MELYVYPYFQISIVNFAFQYLAFVHYDYYSLIINLFETMDDYGDLQIKNKLK